MSIYTTHSLTSWDKNLYRLNFCGRPVGSIGAGWREVELIVEAPDEEAAKLKAYDTHEHINSMRCVPYRPEVYNDIAASSELRESGWLISVANLPNWVQFKHVERNLIFRVDSEAIRVLDGRPFKLSNDEVLWMVGWFKQATKEPA